MKTDQNHMDEDPLDQRKLSEGHEQLIGVVWRFTTIGFTSLLPSIYLVYFYFWYYL